jgi:hypothetical protein
MERSQNASPIKNRVPFRGLASPMRNFEEAVMERIVKYLSRRVRRPNRSHFCCFMLFLLSGRLCEMV